jgi:FkbM family methyltransferase
VSVLKIVESEQKELPLEIKEMEDGAKFYVHSGSAEDLIVHDAYGGDYVKYFEVEEGEVWYDIGANIGAFSIYAARNGAARVYAYEPVPVNYNTFVKNIALNKLEDIVIAENVAIVANDKDSVRMWPQSHNTGGSSMYRSWVEGSIEAKAKDIRTIILQDNCCVKMDCEGAEEQLLPTLDLHKITKLTFEYHHFIFDHYGGLALQDQPKYTEIMNRLKEEFPNTNSLMWGHGCSTNWAWR